MSTARRITVYERSDGWHFRVQGGNWKIIAASEEGKKSKARLINSLRKQYPTVEIVESPPA